MHFTDFNLRAFLGRGIHKTVVRAMKLTGILLIIALLHVSAAGLSQKVTLSLKDAPLEKVFDQIKQQTGLSFLWDEQVLTKTMPVTLDVKDAAVSDVLDACLKNQGLSYSIIQNMVVIKKSSPIIRQPMVSTPPVEVHGRVTDSLGNPLAGASVTIKGSKSGTSTDANGNFVLSNVKDNATMFISYTGYESRQIKVDGSSDVSVHLNKSNSPLDEVQVIAYGTTTQRLSTGDVTTIQSKVIEQQPVSNPILALEGRVPGLSIIQSTGLPGSGVTVRIQGQNSINNGNDPFYVIDGVPYTSQVLPALSGIQGNSGGVIGGVVNSTGGNPLNYINPSDIESITVLKDADATSIYGSRAANGAILITTKKGKGGRTNVEVNMQNGWGKVTRMLDVLNTPQYLQMRHEAIANDGQTTGPTDYDINGTWDTTSNTNWQKTLIGGTAHYATIDASISGGNARTQYLVGGTYHRETTVFPGDFADQKGSGHFSLNTTSDNQKLKFQLSANYLVDNNNIMSSDITFYAVSTAPDAPTLYNKDGSLNWAPTTSGTSTWTNPLSYLLQTYSIKTSNLISSAVISYEFLPGFKLLSNFGYTNLQSDEKIISPLTVNAPENRPFSQRVGVFGDNNINSWVVEPQLNYKGNIGLGKLEVLLGASVQQNNSEGQQLYGVGYNSDLVIGDIKSASTIIAGSSINSMYKYNALFGRLNYNWMDKYLIDITIRRDGSSRFGEQNQYHNFGAAGLGWIFSQEDFIRDNFRFLSFGKLRASYGTTGSDQIGDYQYLSLYSPVNNVSVAYQGITGLLPNGLPNPYLQWEETKKLQFGLEMGFLKDRITFILSYFQNHSSNQLLPYALPIIAGFSSITKNFPATVENSGLEFSLTTTNIKTANFNWITQFNLSILRNKLESFPNIENSSYSSALVIGQPITIQKVYHLLGVNDTTGIYQFAGTKGTPTYSPTYGTDNNIIINTSPEYYGGFQNDFVYGNIELDIFFQFVKQKGLNYFYGSLPGYHYTNQPIWVLNSWHQPGDHAAQQQYSSTYANIYQQYSDASRTSDGAYTDASYIRLKNISFNYRLPDKWVRKMNFQNCKIYIQGQNIFTITSYKGMDPETLSSTTLPPLKIWVIGLRFGL